MLRKSRASVGIQVALAMMVPAKSKAGTEVSPKLPKKEQAPEGQKTPTAPPELTGRWDFSRLFTVAADPEVVHGAQDSAKEAQHAVHDAWKLTVKAAQGKLKKESEKKAQTGQFTPPPMTHEEVRLWLQSFNAGPYALLKYKGDVPYKETQDYVPRVLKYYEEIDESPYDEQIQKAATRYGLDPRMIRAIMKTESSFRNDTVSHAGARGLMQVMPVVWKDVKEKYDLDWEYSTGVFEPEKNIEVACAYLAWLRYDFLPRHFEVYDLKPEAPDVLVRDHDRGVPDRESPRIIAASDETTQRSTEVAAVYAPTPVAPVSATDAGAGEAPAKQVAEKPAPEKNAVEKPKAEVAEAAPKAAVQASKKSESAAAEKKSEEPKASRGKIEVTDADGSRARKSSNGKSKVVMRGGSGKKITIHVDSKGKVTPAKETKVKEVAKASKRPAGAEITSVGDEDGTGG